MIILKQKKKFIWFKSTSPGYLFINLSGIKDINLWNRIRLAFSLDRFVSASNIYILLPVKRRLLFTGIWSWKIFWLMIEIISKLLTLDLLCRHILGRNWNNAVALLATCLLSLFRGKNIVGLLQIFGHWASSYLFFWQAISHLMDKMKKNYFQELQGACSTYLRL